MDLITRFKKVITEQHLISKKDRVLIAVSGGVDSVVLFHLFYYIKDEFLLSLKIVHLNHNIRGEEANRDRKFVEQLAEQYNIPTSVAEVDVPQYIQEQKYSIEEGARILRYQFFNEELEKSEYNYLALGHNANDQAETILDHFIRGSGIRGLSGMNYIRGQFIRPMLSFTRKEIETYAQKNSLSYVTDTSNMEIKYKRNKIRHQLIPYLQAEFNPNIVNTILQTGNIIQENNIFLKSEAKKVFKACLISYKKNKIILDIEQFLSYFSVLQVYVLFYLSELFSIEEKALNFSKINNFLSYIKKGKIGTKFPISSEWEIIIDHNGLVLYQPDGKDFEFKITLKKHYALFDNEKIFTAQLINKEQLPKIFTETKNVEYIDFDKAKDPLTIRNYRPGDRFIPLNMKGHKKVSDFFTDKKVPLHLRKEIPLLTCSEDIIWIVGYQIDDRFKITDNSQTILKIEIKEGENDGNQNSITN